MSESPIQSTASGLSDVRVALGAAAARATWAMASGRVQLGQAQVIVHALADLRKELSAGRRAEAEETMIGDCAVFGPVPLSFIGRSLEEILAP